MNLPMDNAENHGLQNLDAIIVVIDAEERVEKKPDVLLAQMIENLLKTGEIDSENVSVKMVLLKISTLKGVLVRFINKFINKILAKAGSDEEKQE